MKKAIYDEDLHIQLENLRSKLNKCTAIPGYTKPEGKYDKLFVNVDEKTGHAFCDLFYRNGRVIQVNKEYKLYTRRLRGTKCIRCQKEWFLS